MPGREPAPTAVDLFAGAGGATAGLVGAGFEVLAAVENDLLAAASYEANHDDVALAARDIRQVDEYQLRRLLGLQRGQLDLLKACPPCQGFSTLASGPVDHDRNDLVLDTARFVTEFRPRALLLENVPGLAHDARLDKLTGTLSRQLGYCFRQYLVRATDFGVPQRRRRLIVLGTAPGMPAPPATLEEALPTQFDRSLRTAGQALDELAETLVPNDPLNRARVNSLAVRERIQQIPINGSRFDLPEVHQLACHQALTKRHATAAYGRVRRDQPAPTMTTRCTTPSCGSFVHPEQHRGLTLREAATLQTFPPSYRFVGGHDAIERQIGNAVPVRLAYALGLVVHALLAQARPTSTAR